MFEVNESLYKNSNKSIRKENNEELPLFLNFCLRNLKATFKAFLATLKKFFLNNILLVPTVPS